MYVYTFQVLYLVVWPIFHFRRKQGCPRQQNNSSKCAEHKADWGLLRDEIFSVNSYKPQCCIFGEVMHTYTRHTSLMSAVCISAVCFHSIVSKISAWSRRILLSCYAFRKADWEHLSSLFSHTPWDVIYFDNCLDLNWQAWMDLYFLLQSTIVSPSKSLTRK